MTSDYAITDGYVDESLMGKSMRLIVDVNYPHMFLNMKLIKFLASQFPK